ncbi:hypothetical protein JM16_008185 [Phytophthora kernoviae]|uniref:Methylated-DNA--protein-cysteine methyltransferase n=1 Tax=Phytophthora kernoviae TaxID=325452 RepID=A0A8T0LPY3_9STRA|nr:hypothetical protein JM16_008185 [Phytophthora kernoviae]
MAIVDAFVSTGTLAVMAQYGLNWNWRVAIAVTVVFNIATDLFMTMLITWAIIRSQWFWLAVPIMSYPPHVVQFIVDNYVVVVELIELGSDGALFGLLTPTTHVAAPFGKTADKIINAHFHSLQVKKMLARSTKLAAALRPQTSKLLSRSFAHRVNMVLKEDVTKLGYRGDEVSVKAGYARNYLYPEKLAVYATDANRQKFKMDQESVDEVQQEKEHELEAIIYHLSNIEVDFKRHTPAKTDVKLTSEVNAQNISDMLEKNYGVIVGVARIDLPTPIKTLGSHTVKVRVDDAIEAEFAAGAVETEDADASEDDKKKGASKKKWTFRYKHIRHLRMATRSSARTAAKKVSSKTTQKGKAATKTTHHIQWRGKQITLFESRVYELISTIPEGKVSTYGGVAQALQSGPRCVGQALRKNPFAPEVPCHRVVAASLGIGGFQGSTGEDSPCIQKKRTLLAKEGVNFTADHRIDAACVHEFKEAEIE